MGMAAQAAPLHRGRCQDTNVQHIRELSGKMGTLPMRLLQIKNDKLFSKVNPDGGTVAFGHPLGYTSARQVATLFNKLERRGRKSV